MKQEVLITASVDQVSHVAFGVRNKTSKMVVSNLSIVTLGLIIMVNTANSVVLQKKNSIGYISKEKIILIIMIKLKLVL